MKMSDVQEALKKFDTNHKIVKNDGERYEIRTIISSEPSYNNSCLNWLQQFSNFTFTQWIVGKNYPKIQKLDLRKDFVCQHSSKNKKKRTESSRNRNKDCKAKICFKLKKINKFTRYKDPYLKDNLNAVISIDFVHSHPVNVSEANSLLRISPETKEKFIEYFEGGMTPTEAKNFHKLYLSSSTPTENLSEVLANAQINPTDRTIYNIHQKWKKKNIKNLDQNIIGREDTNIIATNDIKEEENEMCFENIDQGDFKVDINDIVNESNVQQTENYQIELEKFKKNLDKFYNFAESHPSKHMVKKLVDFNQNLQKIDNEESFYNTYLFCCGRYQETFEEI